MLIYYITHTLYPSIHLNFSSFDERIKNILISHLKRVASHSQSESHHLQSETILTFQASSLEHYSHHIIYKILMLSRL